MYLSGRPHMQSDCAGAVQTQFSVLGVRIKKTRSEQQNDSKNHQKINQNPPKIDTGTCQKTVSKKVSKNNKTKNP